MPDTKWKWLYDAKARAQAATPGPMIVVNRGGMGYDIDAPSGQISGTRGMFYREEDAEFHAGARETQLRLCRVVNELREALEQMTELYVQLVNSGECGFWNPETTPEVIAARKVLASAGEPNEGT